MLHFHGALFAVEANFNINYSAGGAKLDICGQHGSIYAERTMGQEDTGNLQINCVRDGKIKSEIVEFSAGNMYTKEVETFARSILDNNDVPVSAKMAYMLRELSKQFMKVSRRE